MHDPGAYLQRIGLRGRPAVADVHRAHLTSIPFENLDPQRGVPVSLVPEDLERKLVQERRGGYCFEQNMLLKAALEHLGADVELLLARVRLGAPPGAVRPRTHLVLRVEAEGSSWHADVGFGLGSLLEPIPFGPGAAHEHAGWRFRVVEEGAVLVLQTERDDGWVDLYGFDPEPVTMADVEAANWHTATHPRSPFVNGLVVATQRGDGTRTSLSSWGGLALTEQTPAESVVTPIAPDEIPELLDARFDLPGWSVGPEGRVVPARDGSVRAA